MSRKRKTESQAIEDIAAAASLRFKREQALLFGECAINLMATCMPISHVKEWLRTQADILDEFG